MYYACYPCYIWLMKLMLVNKQKHLRFSVTRPILYVWYGAIACAVSLLLNMTVFNSMAQMLTVSVTFGATTPTTRQGAIDIMNGQCNSGLPVGSGTYITYSLDQGNHTITYTTHTVYRRCNGTETRAFALVGIDGLCKLTGHYAASDNAYDCVKYTGGNGGRNDQVPNVHWGIGAILTCPSLEIGRASCRERV